MKEQGAIELNCVQFNCRHLAGQGATEYLVLLAVVLIVALVSVALLGFFPGMASDAQETQSKMYWQGASPIAITEWAARYVDKDNDGVHVDTQIYMRIMNTGVYPIRLSKVLVNGQSTPNLCSATPWWCGSYGGFEVMYLYPGDEKVFGMNPYFPGLPLGTYGSDVGRFFVPGYQMPGSMSVNCSRTAPYGTAVMTNFGFEYIQYIENTQITKRQIGAKPVVIKCMNNYN